MVKNKEEWAKRLSVSCRVQRTLQASNGKLQANTLRNSLIAWLMSFLCHFKRRRIRSSEGHLVLANAPQSSMLAALSANSRTIWLCCHKHSMKKIPSLDRKAKSYCSHFL